MDEVFFALLKQTIHENKSDWLRIDDANIQEVSMKSLMNWILYSMFQNKSFIALTNTHHNYSRRRWFAVSFVNSMYCCHVASDCSPNISQTSVIFSGFRQIEQGQQLRNVYTQTILVYSLIFNHDSEIFSNFGCKETTKKWNNIFRA